MDFEFAPEEIEFRRKLAAFIAEHCTEGVVPGDQDGARYVDTPARRAFVKALAKGGYLGLTWPKEYGGQGLPMIYDYLLIEELARAGAPHAGKGIGIIGRTLMRRGTEEQKKKFLPMILNAEIEWAIGYSEPEAGSDLASLKIRATRDGDGWRVRGQKRFSTSAHFADWYWLAVRTDPDVPKHKGITLVLVDLKSPGIQVNPMWCINGERTNEVFLDDVWVPDSQVVGEPGKGFYYISEALDYERHALFPYGTIERMFEWFLDWVRTATRDGRPVKEDPQVRRTVADLAARLEVARMHSLRVVDAMNRGESANLPAAMNKLAASEFYRRLSNAALDLMGPGGWLRHGSKRTTQAAVFENLYRTGIIMTVGAGSSEVQRNIIARRGLGLPNPV